MRRKSIEPKKVDFAANIERFTGFAAQYDANRPAPPTALADILTSYAGTKRPELVVDLGSGTGLSTRYWAEVADEVIGVEPTPDMRRRACRRITAPNITFRGGLSHDTGLPDRCAQIVTCAQALHWMAPQPTFDEAARILQPGGLFAAFDYYWPPITGAWQVEAAYINCMAQVTQITEERNLARDVRFWKKAEHLARMEASGRFRFTKEFVIHHRDQGDAERFIGLFFSQGSVATVLKAGLSEGELGIDQLRAAADRCLGLDPQTWYWSCHVRLGIV